MLLFLKTKQALRLPQTAPHEDMSSLQSARSTCKSAATVLNPVLNTIHQRSQSQQEMTGAAISGMNAMLKITENTENLSFNINNIEAALNSIATVVEEMAASASTISENALNTVQQADEIQKKITSGNQFASSLKGDFGLLESSVNSMTQGVEKFIAFTSDINKLTTKTQVNEINEYLQQSQSSYRKQLDLLTKHDDEYLLLETIKADHTQCQLGQWYQYSGQWKQ